MKIPLATVPYVIDDRFEIFMRHCYTRVKPTEQQYKESRNIWFAAQLDMIYHILKARNLSEEEFQKEIKQIIDQFGEFQHVYEVEHKEALNEKKDEAFLSEILKHNERT